MSRKITKRKLNNTIAVIVDGKDEKWYIEMIKQQYQSQCPSLKNVRIEPDLPQEKKMEELFNLAETKHSEGYKQVVLIIDLDTTNSNPKEFQKFEVLYKRYEDIKKGILTGRQASKNNWMRDLTLIINNPCLEYWYIIHFQFTNRFFDGFEELKPLLQKYLPDYEKSEKYYKGNPDIYTRLGSAKGLAEARKNAKKFSPFDFKTCQTSGITEMDKLFDFFDSI